MRSTGSARSIPQISAPKRGLTSRTSMAMQHSPSALAKIRRSGGRVNRAKLVAAYRDRAHCRGELVAEIGKWQGRELLFEAEGDDAVHGREEGTREDPARVAVEIGQKRNQRSLDLREQLMLLLDEPLRQ